MSSQGREASGMHPAIRQGSLMIPNRFRQPILNRLVSRRLVDLASDDILLSHYPKGGSTWLRFLITAAAFTTDPTFPDVVAAVPALGAINVSKAPSFESGGRLIHTHFAADRLRTSAENTILVLVRDPRSVVTSYFRHEESRTGRRESMDSFVKRFVKGGIDHYGTWAEHVDAALKPSSRAVVVIRYEDLIADPAATLLSTFRAVGLEMQREDVDRAVQQCSRDKMRAQEHGSNALVGYSQPFVGTGGRESVLTKDQERSIVTAFEDQMVAIGYLAGG